MEWGLQFKGEDRAADWIRPRLATCPVPYGRRHAGRRDAPRAGARTANRRKPRTNTMNDDNDKTKPPPSEFDISAYPADALFHERRSGFDRRFGKRRKEEAEGESPSSPPANRERRVRKERRRRVDPITFEKQYTDDELEFMNAIQRFKERSGKAFPSHAEVIKVAVSLGYRKLLEEDPSSSEMLD